jgi:hypothetical protein
MLAIAKLQRYRIADLRRASIVLRDDPTVLRDNSPLCDAAERGSLPPEFTARALSATVRFGERYDARTSSRR